MRCLYCGKELALLKRLTGGGEFCSDAHKQSYQEEYNRLALSRLLQAQKKTEKPEKIEKAEKSAKSNKAQAPETLEPQVVPEPVVEAPVVQAMETQVVEAPPAAPAFPEPVETMGFLVELPPVVATQDAAPYLELEMEVPPAPAVPVLSIEPSGFDLPSASMVPLHIQPTAASAEQPVRDVPSSPGDFENRKPATPSAARQPTNLHSLPSASPAPMEVALRSMEFKTDDSLAEPVDFGIVTEVWSWPNWELPGTGIDFPAEDSDVVVAAWLGNGDRELWMDLVPVENGAETLHELPAESEPTPRAALEALSRLHHELTAEEETSGVQTATLVAESPAEAIAEATAAAPAPAYETEAAFVDAVAAQPDPAPRAATELVEITIKTHGPSKPSPMTGEALLVEPPALLPRLQALPLRPKVAPAPEYTPAPEHTSESKAAEPPKPVDPPKPESESKPKVAPASVSSRPAIQPKPVPVKPMPASPRAAQRKQPVGVGKVTAPAAAQAAEPAKPGAAVETVKVEEPATPAPSAETKPVAPAAAADSAKPSAPAQPPSAPETKAAKAPAAEAPPKPEAAPTQKLSTPNTDEVLPSFGAVQPSSSFMGSMKMKLGIGILLIAGACISYFGWGSKPHTPVAVADGAGPSIIIGEGGWVEGWGGDPANAHVGREITLYRPSLKLSDYRIEFQGKIETKSLGWVFRAADPENYYAMKLATVSSGLTSKVALFKYLVTNGKQTQVGRVPIDLTVRPDTSFSVRVDVRGPQFTTYIQGQQVDTWTDDQLKTGGVGLLNEREERGQVKSVSIRILSGAGK